MLTKSGVENMFHLEIKCKISTLLQLFFQFTEHMNSKRGFFPLPTQMQVEVFLRKSNKFFKEK